MQRALNRPPDARGAESRLRRTARQPPRAVSLRTHPPKTPMLPAGSIGFLSPARPAPLARPPSRRRSDGAVFVTVTLRALVAAVASIVKDVVICVPVPSTTGALAVTPAPDTFTVVAPVRL